MKEKKNSSKKNTKGEPSAAILQSVKLAVQGEEKMAYLALTDDLTGLFNRRYFYQCLSQEIEKAMLSKKSLSLLMIDLDHFKQINDTHGHLAGDTFLAEVANRLRNAVRGGDIVVRYAGDEFIALLPGAPADQALPAAQRIFNSVTASPVRLEGTKPDLNISLSVGVATYPDDAQEQKVLVDKADRALYYSKKAGRNRISVFSQVSAQLEQEACARVLSPCPKLIGRRVELDSMTGALERIIAGRGGLFFSVGDTGIGKTRLLNELQNQAEAKNLNCVVAHCEESKKTSPYSAVAEALGRYISSLDLEKTKKVRRNIKLLGGGIVELIPELYNLVLEEPEKILSHEEKRAALFQELANLLVGICEQAPLLLLLDDLQWADKASLELLAYLGRDINKAPLLIAGTVIKEGLDQSPETGELSISDLLSSLQHQDGFQKISLRPLSQDQVAQMIAAMLPASQLAPEFVSALYEASEGNPLFVEEALKLLVSEGAIYFEKGNWVTKPIKAMKIPRSLKDVIRRQIEQLDDETRGSLAQAAAIGEDFSFDLLREATGKNDGYVLDIIDKARKAQLISEEQGLDGNQFNFANQQIREVVYELIDKETRKNLHKKIGESLEKIFGDQIEGFVSELAYHFKEGGDSEKASGYATKASVRNQELYAPRAIKPRKGAPQVVAPLDDETLNQAVDCLRFLRAAIINTHLYPAASNVRIESVKNATASLTAILEKRQSFTISEARGVLLVEGSELNQKLHARAAIPAFITLLTERGIRSLTFLSGTTPEELSGFLEVFNERPEKLKEEGGLPSIIVAKKISHIVVNERVYVMVGEGQQELDEEESFTSPWAETAEQIEARRKADRKKEELFLRFLKGMVSEQEPISDILADSAEMGKLLKQVATGPDDTMRAVKQIAIAASSSDQSQEVAKSAIATALIDIDSSILTKILVEEPPAEVKSLGVRDEVLSKLSETQIIDVVEELAKNYQNLKRKNLVEPAAKREMTRLNKLLDDLLSGPKGGIVLPKVYNKLVDAGIVRESPVQKDEKNDAVSKTHRLLKGERLALLEENVSSEILPLIQELVSLKRQELADKLIEKLLENLSDSFPSVRLQAVRTFKKIQEDTIAQNPDLLTGFEETLIKGMNKEGDLRTYSLIVDVLREATVVHIISGQYDKGLMLLGLFDRHRNPKSKRPPEQQGKIGQALEIVENKTIDALIENLQSEDTILQSQTVRMLVRLEEKAVSPLITLLKETVDPRIRKNVAEALKGIGEKALDELKAQVRLENPPHMLESILEVIGTIGDDSAVEQVVEMLRSEDSSVRRQAIYALSKMPGMKANAYLAVSLKDKDPSIRQELARLLGNIGDRIFVPTLLDLIRKRERRAKEEIESVQQEACQALAKIGDEKAIPVLIEALHKERFLSLRKTKTDIVRASAARALGEFSDEQALQALKVAASDRSQTVRTAATAGLEKLQRNLVTSPDQEEPTQDEERPPQDVVKPTQEQDVSPQEGESLVKDEDKSSKAEKEIPPDKETSS